MGCLKVVKCKKIYWPFVMNLRNHPSVMKNMFSKRAYGSDEFISEMYGRSQFFRIVLIDNHPAGYYKVLNNEISIVVHPDYRGQGVASFMVKHILKRFKGKPLEARIRVSNRASIKLFEKFGFMRESITFVRGEQ